METLALAVIIAACFLAYGMVRVADSINDAVRYYVDNSKQ